MSKLIDLTGKIFGRLTVIKYMNKYKWLCKCSCGNEKEIRSDMLKSGTTKSCGCLQKETCSNLAKKYNKNKLFEDRTLAAFNQLYGNYKYSAKRRNYIFELTKEEFKNLTKQKCYYCDTEPIQIHKCNSSIYIYNGIDRINNDLGYNINNCVPCCGDCNKLKYQKSFSDYVEYIKRVYNALKNKNLIKES
jgi:hypothetical protein